MSRAGGCSCGEVRFVAAAVGAAGACHCDDCRRWAGGPTISVPVAEADMTVTGARYVAPRRTSPQASRSRCALCGSPLWYRGDDGEAGTGDYIVSLGLFDDPNGIPLSREIFIDVKPDGYAFAGDHPRLTRAEALPGASSQGD